jgi:hypothetical protein
MNTILNLLNISYCQASNDNTSNTSEENCGDSANMYYYMVYLYLIAIYIYSMYLMRYGRTDTEYDLLVNVDVEYQHSSDYIRLLLVERYLTNIIAMFATYSKNELGIAKQYVPMTQQPMSQRPTGSNLLPGMGVAALGTAGTAGVALVDPSVALGKAGDLFNNAGNAIGDPSVALGKAGDLFNNAGNAIGDPSVALGKAGDMFNNVGDAIGDPSEALGKAGDMFNNAGDAIGDPSEALGKAGDMFNNVGDAIGDPSEALGKAGDFFTGNTDSMSDLFSSIWGD